MDKDILKFITHLSNESGKIVNSYFRTELNVESKKDDSPVTIADKKAEEKLREIIMKEVPEHGIIGEEFGKYKEDAEYQWILDPIDGTKSFISGSVLFGTLICLLKNNTPIYGAINLPMLNQFVIGDNEETLLNGVKVHVKNCPDISRAVVLTTDIKNIEKYRDISKFNNLIKKSSIFRTWGDCYGYYLVASGYADVMIDPIMSIWDTAAVIPVIRGAGGLITDFNGLDALNSDSVIAGSPVVQKQVVELLK
ncbi:MAG: inositol monophosphatase family protein [Bacteroidota bacterium]|nr:inositol monophosphatase family protein [Bacteroidota bacterium]